MKRIVQFLKKPEFNLILFFLGAFLFIWPYITQKNMEDPLYLFGFLYIAWLVLILIQYIQSKVDKT